MNEADIKEASGLAKRVEDARKKGGSVREPLVAIFLWFLDHLRDDDQQTMCDMAIRHARKRGWQHLFKESR